MEVLEISIQPCTIEVGVSERFEKRKSLLLPGFLLSRKEIYAYIKDFPVVSHWNFRYWLVLN